MAAVTHRVATPSTTALTAYNSGSFTPAVGDLLVGLVGITGSLGSDPILASSTGLFNFELVADGQGGTAADRIQVFIAQAFIATAASQTVQYQTSDAGTGCIVAVASLSSMLRKGAQALRQSKVGFAANSAVGLNFDTACLTGNPTIGFAINDNNPAGLTVPSGWTQLFDTGYSSPTTGANGAGRNSGFTGTLMQWGISSHDWGAVLLEFDTTAPPPAASVKQNYYRRRR